MKNLEKKQIEVESVITPSSLLPNKAGQFFKSLFLGTIKEQFADRFGDSPYSLRNRKKYEMVTWVSYVLQILSIGFALSFSVHLLGGLLPNIFGGAKLYVSIGIGLALLLVLEIAKRHVVTDFADSYLKSTAIASGHKINYANGLLALILIALSIYSSVAGAKYFVELQTDKTVEITNTGQSKKDSLAKIYANELQTVRGEIKEMRKFWVAPKSKNAKILEQKENLLASLIAQKEQALQGLDKSTQSTISGNQINTSDIALKMLCFSFGCEILTLVCLWFLASYVFKSGLEMGAGSGGANQTNKQTENNESSESGHRVIGFALPINKRTIQGRNGRIVFAKSNTKPKTQNPIGFRIPQTKPNFERITVNVPNVERHDVECKDGERICLHCGCKFTHKHWNAKYCKDECRINAWQLRTSKTFKKGKKSK